MVPDDRGGGETAETVERRAVRQAVGGRPADRSPASVRSRVSIAPLSLRQQSASRPSARNSLRRGPAAAPDSRQTVANLPVSGRLDCRVRKRTQLVAGRGLVSGLAPITDAPNSSSVAGSAKSLNQQ